MLDQMPLRTKIFFLVTCACILLYTFTSAENVGRVVSYPTTKYETYIDIVPIIEIEEYPEEETFTETICSQVAGNYLITDVRGAYECIELSTECERQSVICAAYNSNGECTQYTTTCAEYKCNKKQASCSFSVENLEKNELTFKGAMLFTDENGEHEADSQQAKVLASEIKEFVWKHALSTVNSKVTCNYVIKEVPTVEKCHDEVKSKIINKKRKVEKHQEIERTVEINSTVNKTVDSYVNRFFGYEQDFYFGY